MTETNTSTELRVANWLTSLTGVMIPMVLIVLGMAVTSSDLIYTIFPDRMTDNQRILGSIFTGVAIGLALFTVMANKDLLTAFKSREEWVGLPLYMLPFEAILLMLFFQVFDPCLYLSWDQMIARLFMSFWIPFLAFVIVTLFMYRKRQKETQIKDTTRIQYLTADKKKLSEEIEKLTEDKKKLTDDLKRSREDQKKLEKFRVALTCHCGHESETAGAHKSHVQRCKHKKS